MKRKPKSEVDPWSLYLYSMKSPVTKEKYQRSLEKFLDFVGIKGPKLEGKARLFAKRAMRDANWTFGQLLNFLQFQKERVDRKEVTGATIRNYVKSIKLFCEVADIPVVWMKLTRGLPRGKRYADDRIPTMEELRNLIEYPDRRIKAIVYTMTSSGFRLGAWDFLRWGNIIPVTQNGNVIAAKVIVYAGEPEEYFTFISGQAYGELKKWMDYRNMAGEQITEESWVMRELWDTSVANGRGLVAHPKKLRSSGVKRLIERAIWAQGLRKKLAPGKKRHPYQAIHSMRKWFKTRCELGGMKPLNIETLLSHSCGISDSYYRPTETELFDDYVKVVQSLTFSGTPVDARNQLFPTDDIITNLADEITILKREMEALKNR
jgi:hypothetical protein